MILPRVLIVGQPFNRKYGGGITLTNLFTGWDRERIAVAATGHVMSNVTTDVCNTYYQLGIEEFKWRFPLNFFQKRYPSGLIRFDERPAEQVTVNKHRRRRYFVTRIFYPILEWLGLFHASASITFSDRLLKWLEEFSPEVLYLQVSSYETIKFAHILHDYLNIPSIIHMMDDWPETISKRGPFKRFWKKKIDRELKRLIDKTDLCFSISEAMSEEYQRRYKRNFQAFHNPIDTSVWDNFIKTDFTLDEEEIKILYSGRIGTGISSSLIEVSFAVNELNKKGIKAKLFIQSPSRNNEIIRRLAENRNVVINPVANYSDLPAIYGKADIMVIANDFDKTSIDFLRYSMPTKASEFMISGTPVLIYSHRETAISRFFTENKCGHCVTENSLSGLVEGFLHMIRDEGYRKELSSNAVRIARNQFDAKKVRYEFQTTIAGLIPVTKTTPAK